MLVSWRRVNIHQRATLGVMPATCFLLRAPSRSQEGSFRPSRAARNQSCRLCYRLHRHLSVPSPPSRPISPLPEPRLSCGHWQRRDPLRHCPAQAPRQMPLGQYEPVVPGMFHQAPAGLDQPLLHTGQRPVVDPPRQYQPPPQVPHVDARTSGVLSTTKIIEVGSSSMWRAHSLAPPRRLPTSQVVTSSPLQGWPTVSRGFWNSGLRFVVGGFWPARSLNRSLFFHEPTYISIEYVIAFATHNLYIVFR